MRRAPAIWLWPWLVLALTACQPAPRPSPVEALTQTEALLTSAAEILGEALALGVVTPADPDYASLYAGLAEANALLDRAWLLYHANDPARAEALRGRALAQYQLLRPRLAALLGANP